jgi:TRAP-type uncharacterized transport system fused permease subunit
MRDLMPVAGGAGLFIGLISLTGVGTSFTSYTVALAKENVFAILALTVLINVLLGAGLPPFAVYAISAVILAPALTQTGVSPLAAHLFILYWALFGQLTPPVAIASLVASNIANTPIWPTAWQSMRVGMMAFVVPFLFLYTPALLLKGSAGEILVAAVASFAAVWVFISGLGDLMYSALWRVRLLGAARIALSLGFMVPLFWASLWMLGVVAAVLYVLLLLAEKWMRPALGQRTSAGPPEGADEVAR